VCVCECEVWGFVAIKVGDRLRGRRKEVGERLEIEVWGNKDKVKDQQTKKCSKDVYKSV
jgi:hypothetical protein